MLGFYALLISMAIMMYVLAVFLPQRLAEIGIESPLLVSVYAVVGSAVVTTLFGLGYAKVKQRLSYAVLLRIAAGAWVLAFLMFGTVSQPVLLLVAPALLGLATGILLPAATVLVDETAGPVLRPRAASLTGTAIFAGQFASPLLLGPLIGATSTSTGFLASAGMAAVILAILVLVRIPEPASAVAQVPAGVPRSASDQA